MSGHSSQEYKQVIVVRADLRLSRGKIAAQAGHAVWSAANKAKKNVLDDWARAGEKKVVLKVKGEHALLEIRDMCEKMRIPHALIADAGHTEIPPGTLTAIGIGPDDAAKIDKVTGSLPLLK